MFQDFKQKQYNGTMETIKNGAYPKSHTSRKNFLFFVLALLVSSFMFNSCQKDKDKDEPNKPISEVKKKPKTAIFSENKNVYHYDNQNRLIGIETVYDNSSYPNHISTITYNPDGTIASYGTMLYQYNKDTIFRYYADSEHRDTLLINDKGQLLREFGSTSDRTYEYNSAGDIIKILSPFQDMLIVTQSNIKSNWRHVNIPNWFYTSFHSGLVNPYETKNGLKPLQVNWSDGRLFRKYTYEVDVNDYVKKIIQEGGNGSIFSWELEYVVIE